MKKISSLILMLSFLLIPTCVNANGVSWEDFISEMEEATGDTNFESNIQNSSVYSSFLNHYNSCYGFSVWGDFGFTSISPTEADNTKLWFAFYKGSDSLENGQFYFTGSKDGDPSYLLSTTYGTYLYVYDISTKELTFLRTGGIGHSSQNLFAYFLSQNNTFSLDRFLSESGADYFLDTSFVMAWNMSALVQYLPNASSNSSSYVTKVVDLSTIDDSNFPWEDGNNGGSSSGDTGNNGGSSSGDTYYNYDFNEYFQKPWITIDNVQGLVQSSATIPFKVMSQSGDEYFPFNSLKLDLRVFKVFTNENGIKTLSLADTYKRYNGDYVDTSSYTSVSQNGKINVYNYDLRSKFDSSFIDTYVNTSGDSFDYAFQLVLYDFWEDELSNTKLFYFNQNNNLNSGTIPDNYYDNNWNSGIDSNLQNMNFNSILNTAKNFLSSIFSVFEIFPDWLIYLLSLGISVGITLRVLGR